MIHCAPRALRLGVLLAGALVCPQLALAQVDSSPEAGSDFRATAVEDFTFTERGGEEVSLEDLLGTPWVAVPFFRGCTGPCPSLTSDLHTTFQERLAGSPVRVVSFTLDASVDTPEALDEYAKTYGIDSDRWLFLTGDDKAELQRFVRESLKVPVSESEEAGIEYGQSITHGTRLPVIDAEGFIAGWYECARVNFEDPADFEASIDALASRALALVQKSNLPLFNAIMNGLATVLMLLGFAAIKRGDREGHGKLMKAAFAASAVFLAGYLYYHLAVQSKLGPTKLNATGAVLTAYYVMLASHILLAIVNLPMILRTLWLAHKEDWERHRWWAVRTFPIWLYVSVTGVIVYLVLYPLNPTP